MGVTSELIKYQTLVWVWRKARSVGRRWRIGLIPVWASVAVLSSAALCHSVLPALGWVWLVLAGFGPYVFTRGPYLSTVWNQRLSVFVPVGLDKGEAETLDALPERIYLGSLIVSICGWSALVAFGGFTAASWWIWLGLSVIYGGSWYLNQRVRVIGKASRYVKRWEKLTKKVDAWKGSTVIRAHAQGGFRQLTVRLPKGTTVDSVQSTSAAIASFYGLRPTGVTVSGSEEHARHAVVSLVPRDPWADTLDHPMPEPGSISLEEHPDGFMMGLSSSGSPDYLRLQHLLIVGQNGSGKSVFVESFLTWLTACRDVVCIGIDMGGGSTLGSWSPVLKFPVATTVEEAVVLLRRVLVLIKAREEELAKAKSVSGSAGDKVIVSPEIPAVVLIIEELPSLTGEGGPTVNKLLNAIAKRARKTQTWMVAIAQNASRNDLGSTEMRSQMKATVALKMDAHASSVLWKQKHNQGYDVSGLKVGQYKIYDDWHHAPQVYKGLMVTSQQRFDHVAKAATVAPHIEQTSWDRMNGPLEVSVSVDKAMLVVVQQAGVDGVSAREAGDVLGIALTTAAARLKKLADNKEVKHVRPRYYAIDDVEI